MLNIKEGQIYEDPIGNRFLIWHIDSCYKDCVSSGDPLTIKCLQATESYFVGELIPTTTDFLKNEKLELTNEVYTEKEDLQITVKEIENKIAEYNDRINKLVWQKEQYVLGLKEIQRKLEECNV